MRTQRFLAGFLLAVAAFSASAFERPFPQNAKRATMSPAAYPAVMLNGATRKLSVAAKIWNPGNLIQMPTSIFSGQYIVNYTENAQGEIDRMWILSAEEASKPAPTPDDPIRTLPIGNVQILPATN